jgi:hypothetical protein
VFGSSQCIPFLGFPLVSFLLLANRLVQNNRNISPTNLVAQLFHFTLTQGFTVHQLGDPDVWVFRRVGHGGQGEGRGPFPS